MQQTLHRSSLGGTPIRPSIGTPRSVSGINSRVQDTAYLLAHYGHGAPASIPRRGVQGINSRVQDTAYLLAHYGHGAPARATPRSTAVPVGATAAALGKVMGFAGVDWLTQGLILAAGTEFVTKVLNPDNLDNLEKEIKIRDAARKLENPFENAGIVGPGVDRQIVIQGPQYGKPNPRAGLGSTGTAAGALSAATAITSAAIKSGSAIGAGSTWLAAAGGPIGVAVAGATIALSYLFSRQRPARKVATTQIVDEVEPLLQQNLTGYLQGPRTTTSQAQALANFDAGWDFVVANCDIPDMGQPGKWCVNDRKRGGQWDWFKRYRDPIANDTAVVPDPGPDVQTAVDPQTGERVYTETAGSVSNMMPLLLALGLGAVALMAGGGK